MAGDSVPQKRSCRLWQRVASAVLMLAPENVRSIEYDLQVLVEGDDYGVRGSMDAMTDQ